jgi:hypothetical protein
MVRNHDHGVYARIVSFRVVSQDFIEISMKGSRQ